MIDLQERVNSDHDTVIIPLTPKDLEMNLRALANSFSVNEDFLQSEFKAEKKEIHSFFAKKKVILMGLGENPKIHEIGKFCRSLAFSQRNKLAKSKIAFVLNDSFFEENVLFDAIESLASNFLLAFYELGKLKTENTDKLNIEFAGKLSFVIDTKFYKNAEKAIEKAKILAEVQQKVFDLVNLPANVLDSVVFSEKMQESGMKYGYEVRVFHKEEIEKMGMNLLLAVNQGSHIPPTFTVMEYKPKSEKKLPKVALLGKGVTFDTGGVSIKDSNNMYFMKCDMAGAAAVAGALEAVARLKLPVHLFGIVPSTDNMVSSKAVVPSAIVKSYSGLSVEIIDTDAEGRLILADGLGYIAKNIEPDVIIDLATLTGSCIMALGYAAAGMFTENEELAQKLYNSGQKTGEKVWRLPLWEEYGASLKSDMADIKNLGAPVAGAASAAKFLEKFTQKHSAWAHLDVAGVTFTDNEFGSQRNATAYGVRLLIDYLENL